MKFLLALITATAVLVSTTCAVSSVDSSTSPGPWTMLLQKLVNGRVRTPISAKYTWLPMNVTSQVVKGGPNVTLYGDTKSINAQMLKMNPNYNAEDFTDIHAVTPPGQPKTAIVPPKCNNWPEGGMIEFLEEGIVEMQNAVYPVIVPMRSCVALSCIDNASIGLCNDNYKQISKVPKNLVVYLEILINNCLSSTGTVNGQVFDTGNFNLVYDSGHCTPPSKGSNYQGPPNTTVGGDGPDGEWGDAPEGTLNGTSSQGDGGDDQDGEYGDAPMGVWNGTGWN